MVMVCSIKMLEFSASDLKILPWWMRTLQKVSAERSAETAPGGRSV